MSDAMGYQILALLWWLIGRGEPTGWRAYSSYALSGACWIASIVVVL